MFKITSNDANRLTIEFSGKLDSDEMKLALDELSNQSKNIESGRMLYRITNFEFPTLGAIGIEISRIPELIRLSKKFDRAAVLTDKTWIGKVGELEGLFIPGLKIKAFELTEETEAEAWLSE
ncbi:hypothetical protein ACH42_13260 [Endozoicomonas sp. (ex Bugula neritina AB1)]|nr:hypothetical protein ACH42_13260 [Endozoicomonas sp. (ex Bugula neritina AB1)]